jgi:uncharacterized protein (DUF433 family)
VTSDPDLMGGEPVIKGTRVPVHAVAAMVEQGESAADILAGYPSLSSEQIELAVIYARAYPQRGRPRKQPWRDTPVHSTRVALKDRGGCGRQGNAACAGGQSGEGRGQGSESRFRIG